MILCLGSVNVDVQVRVDRWPEASETLLGRDFIMIGGGKAANRAILARKLEAPSAVLAHLGDDALADLAEDPLARAGVDTSGLRRVAGRATAVASIFVRPDGHKTIILAPNANDAWTEADRESVVTALRRAPRGSVLAVDLEIPTFIVRAALQAAAERDIPVVLDPSPADRMQPDFYRWARYITPNAAEAAGLLPEGPRDDPAAMGRALVERGVDTALMKRDDGGCLVVWAGGEASIPPARAESVVDTTGAGDAFAGALAVAVFERRDRCAAARWAVAAASAAVQGYGSAPAYPDRAALERVVATLPDPSPQ